VSVGEDDARRAVPRLDESGVVAKGVSDLLVELRVPLPGLGQEHRDRVADVAPVPTAADEELQRVVEAA